MSQELYTFACPVCGVHLSVPRSLAGVRGPCPQCHREIIAPEPAEPGFSAALDDPPVTPQRTAAARIPERGPPPPPPDRSVAIPVASGAQEPEDEEADEFESTDSWEGTGSRELSREGSRGPSRLVALCGLVVLVALVAAAVLNFLPANSLRFGKAQPADPSADSPPPTEPDASNPATAPGAGATTPDPVASTPPEIAQSPAASAPSERASALDPPASLLPGSRPPGTTANEGTPAAPDPPEAPVVQPATQVAKALNPPAPASDPPSLLPDLSRSPAPVLEGEATAAELAEPLKALEDFLRSPTWKERLAFCLHPDQIRTEMAEYYAAGKDGPQSHTSAVFMASSPLRGPKFMVDVFHVTFPDLPQGFPIPVEQTDQGWKIDWRIFIEFRDSRLRKFLAKYQDPPATFRVQIERSHYYDKDVPNLDEKYCFRVSAPIHGHEGYVFVDKRDSIAVPKLEDKLGWNRVHQVMVKLKWVKGTGGHPYVELRDIPANSWRDESSPRLGQK